MPKFDPAKIKKVSFSLPFGIGSVEWEVDPMERKAAWSLCNPHCSTALEVDTDFCQRL